ncbi:MAG: glycosyltransferase [Acidobacteria bacterium]|nr:glycosyltransferase [Acidobacteriota bacterium]
MKIACLIPALNERESIGRVIAGLPQSVSRVIVADNGSRDGTPEVARAAGAEVVFENHRGYGSACLRGIAHLRAQPPDVLIFIDGDFSDHPDEMPALVDPIVRGDADLVIGSRVRGQRDPGALLPQAIFGNWLATSLIGWLFGFRYTDLGPFRAIRFQRLLDLEMDDRDFGWTVQMQVRALVRGLRVHEVPVKYRRRIGKSKISGTVIGSFRAGTVILRTIWQEWRLARRRHLAGGGGS